MKTRLSVSRTLKTWIALLVVAGPLIGVAGPGEASAATCVSWTGTQPANPSSIENILTSTAVLSSCNAWAVGHYYNGTANQTLIEHWNGASWKQVAGVNPGGSSNDHSLSGVRAVSATNIWAVGEYFDGTSTKTLIEHWNGTAWTQVASPNPSSSANDLDSLYAISATSIWAVGSYYSGSAWETLIEHWDGTAWRHVPSPNPSATHNTLTAVAASSSTNAWAVGFIYNSSGAFQTFMLHWNGTAWKHVFTPHPGDSNGLYGVTALSSANAWAVGFFDNSSRTPQTLVLHWNGTSWAHVPSPSHGSLQNALQAVTTISASNIWAVGYYHNGTNFQTLIEHWNGTSWKYVSSPDPGGSAQANVLYGVRASSPSNIWAVGYYSNATSKLTLALHCC